MADPTSLEVRYISTRAEVMQWYARAWVKRLWVFHLFIAVSVVFVIGAGGAFSISSILVGCAAAALMCLFMALWPLARFKPEERWLKVDARGVETAIGKRQGAKTWREIRSISPSRMALVLEGKNGNAFIVPARAFSNPDECDAFCEQTQMWWRAATAAH